MPPTVGSKAPEAILRDSDGNEVRLRAFLGETNIVLAFYGSAFSEDGKRELLRFQDRLKDFQTAHTQVVAVSMEPWPSQRAYARELNISFPLLSDCPGYQASLAYDAWDLERNVNRRITYVIDKHGIVQGVIPEGQNPEAHVEEALKIVGTLDM